MKKQQQKNTLFCLLFLSIGITSWGQNLFTQDTLTFCSQGSYDMVSPFPSNFNVWKKTSEEEVIVSSTMTFRSSGWYHLYTSSTGVNDVSVCQVFNLSNSYAAPLNVPLGYQITSLQIALWGTPNVNCSNPTPSSCNTNVTSIINRSLVGKTNFTYYSGDFPDPCTGTQKYLYAKYTCTPYIHDSIYVNIIPTQTLNVPDFVSCNNLNQEITLNQLSCDTTFQLIQTITQSANNTTQSTLSLDKGQLYRLKVSNTVSFGGGAGNQKDGAYFNYPLTPIADIFWRFNGYQPGPLSQFRPIPDGYNSNHIYYFYFMGDGTPQDIGVYDCCLGDNSGSLSIDVEKVIINANCGLNYILNNVLINNVFQVEPSNQINHLYISNGAVKCLVDSFYVYPGLSQNIDLGQDTLRICGTNTTLDATNSAAASYLWNTGETSPSISVSLSGEYHVSVTNSVGCSSSDSVYVSVIDPTITAGQSAFCLGDSSNLSVNNSLSIWWSDGTTNQTSIQVQPIQTTTYSVTVSDGVGICTDSILIQVNNPQVNAGVDLAICAGDSATLAATGADTYAWDNGVANGQPFTPTVDGYYTVVGTDTLGCSNTVSVFLDVLQPTSSTISPVSCDSYTAPDNALYNNSGQYTAIIPNAAGCDSTITINLTLNNSNSGIDSKTACDSYTWIDGNTYTESTNSAIFTLQNTNGCDSVVTLNLTINKLQTLNAGSDQSVCKGENVILTASGAETYSWNNGVSDAIAFSPPLGTTTYTVTGTDGNGCTDTDEVIVTSEYCFEIPGALSPNSDNNNDTWEITGLQNYPNAIISVFDRWGQKIYEGTSTSAPWEGKYKEKELPTADYYYIIELGNGDNYNGVVTLKQ